MSQRIQNLYIARLTTNERPCYVCNKFTAVVLTLADNSNLDWFYICRSHLGDTNLCTRIGGPAGEANKSASSSPKAKKKLEDRPPESDSVSDLVASIGSAWNSWRKKPSQDEDDKKDDDKKKKDNDDDKKDAKKTKDDDKEEQEEKTDKVESASVSPKSPQQPIRFILNRDYFYMRQREYTKKIQKKVANNKLTTLDFPEVPKTHPK
ncbi:VPS4-associated protein 1 [Phascolomyces articulosus]|uniref:VPS4-associated protein 1 n=1 Tax=Phascolomyces articulosus TaxID=60185 RepID=A0AAD5KF33_9FUNG|nr:VPS4-associated protein 1 [Phascolomyces articulosus]